MENQDILGPIEPIDSWPLMTHQTALTVTRQIRKLSTVTVAVYLRRSKSHFPASLHLLWGNSTVYSTIHYSSRFLSFSVKFWNLLILIDSSIHRDDTRDVQQSFVLRQRFFPCGEWQLSSEDVKIHCSYSSRKKGRGGANQSQSKKQLFRSCYATSFVHSHPLNGRIKYDFEHVLQWC